MADWRYEGEIYNRTQEPLFDKDKGGCLYAPDAAQGADGRYYLYYSLNTSNVISVAVCDTPAGKYEFYGHVKFQNGARLGERPDDDYQFDPAVFVDDDGRIWLYSGFNMPFVKKIDGYRLNGVRVMELCEDMVTIKANPTLLFARKEPQLGNHQFFEAASMRKVHGKYYFIYSSVQGHELCYATSDRPDTDFRFGGTIISNGDRFSKGKRIAKARNYDGNNHGSIIKLQDQWYVFYHRHTNQHAFSRQACAEPIEIRPGGSILQAEMTSCGLNGAPLPAQGRYEAYIACNLSSRFGAGRMVFSPKSRHPYFTQSLPDRNKDPDQFIANMRAGAYAGFKYFQGEGTKRLAVEVRGRATGKMLVLSDLHGGVLLEIPVSPADKWDTAYGEIILPKGAFPLFFKFVGKGAIDFRSFEFIEQ